MRFPGRNRNWWKYVATWPKTGIIGTFSIKAIDLFEIVNTVTNQQLDTRSTNLMDNPALWTTLKPDKNRPTLSSLVSLAAAITTTTGATSADKIGVMTTLGFHWRLFWYMGCFNQNLRITETLLESMTIHGVFVFLFSTIRNSQQWQYLQKSRYQIYLANVEHNHI